MTHKTLTNVKGGTLISYEKKVQVYTSYLVFVTLLILALSSAVQ